MKVKLKNRFHMLKVVHDTCTESLTAINSIPACGDAYLRLKSIIEEIETSMQLQLTDFKGLTREKNYLKLQLAETTVVVACGVMSYAHKNHDYFTEGEMRCSVSKLVKLSDDVVIEKCKLVFKKATELLSELPDYSIDATLLDKLQTRIKDFEKISPKVSEAIDARKMHTAKLDKLISDASDLLRNELDRLVVLIDDTHTDFKIQYKNARSVDDRHGRKNSPLTEGHYGSISGSVCNSVDNGFIEEAEVTIEELNMTATTDEDGEYYFEKVPAGIYTLKASAVTYIDEVVKSVEVFADTEITVDIGMNSEE